jgi:hypothetical protein
VESRVLREEVTFYFCVNTLLERPVGHEKVNYDEEHENWCF